MTLTGPIPMRTLTFLHRTRTPTGMAAGSLALFLVLALSACGEVPESPTTRDLELNLLIVNGRIVDGQGNPWYGADLGIWDGRIVAVGDLSAWSAGRVLDVVHNVGLTPVRRLVLGEEDVEPTGERMEAMRRLVREGVEDGALAVPTSLIYLPPTTPPPASSLSSPGWPPSSGADIAATSGTRASPSSTRHGPAGWT